MTEIFPATAESLILTFQTCFYWRHIKSLKQAIMLNQPQTTRRQQKSSKHFLKMYNVMKSWIISHTFLQHVALTTSFEDDATKLIQYFTQLLLNKGSLLGSIDLQIMVTPDIYSISDTPAPAQNIFSIISFSSLPSSDSKIFSPHLSDNKDNNKLI